MLTPRAWASPKRALCLLALGLVAACASVLGIEDRTLDTAGAYPPEGYDGCRPGLTCAGCLDVHRPECEARALCSTPDSLGACAQCVCQNCVDPVVDCRLDAGCAAIWDCLQASRCDLSDGSAGSCVTACGSVIEANGGVRGAAFQSAAAVRTCAITSSCFGCLPPSPEASPACTRQNDCQQCDDCFHECLCSGDRFSVCQEACGAQAPPAACSEGDCQGCGSCFDLCTCGGGDFAQCSTACQAEQSCTPATSCAGCADCVTQCVCNGGAQAECEQSCTSAPAGECIISTRGQRGTTCDGCTSCLADCECAGGTAESCMRRCDMLQCCDSQTCGAALSYCVCGGEPLQKCAEDSYSSCDDATGCDACPCRECGGEYRLCQETGGCLPIFDCMRGAGCQGAACAERCGAGQESGQAFQVAEALWSCSQGAACACDNPPITCGTTRCEPYVGSSAALPACCVASDGGATTEASCGLDLSGHITTARGCIPLGQEAPPRGLLLETCGDSLTISDPPYDGATLKGCCRTADSVCGFWDDITGLGCIAPDTFGQTTHSCAP